MRGEATSPSRRRSQSYHHHHLRNYLRHCLWREPPCSLASRKGKTERKGEQARMRERNQAPSPSTPRRRCMLRRRTSGRWKRRHCRWNTLRCCYRSFQPPPEFFGFAGVY